MLPLQKNPLLYPPSYLLAPQIGVVLMAEIAKLSAQGKSEGDAISAKLFTRSLRLLGWTCDETWPIEDEHDDKVKELQEKLFTDMIDLIGVQTTAIFAQGRLNIVKKIETEQNPN